MSFRSLFLCAVILSGIAQASDRKYLNIGDPAPSLSSVKWLKGGPVNEFVPGQVYVVEFWATWCGPCKENIPHLTELAKKYKDRATILGVSIWESNDPGSADYMGKVESFVKNQGDQMNYLVAADLPEGKVATEWMKAADESGIPATFIVGKDGKIAWIGHPAWLETVLSEIVADKYDMAAARERRATEVETVRPIREAMAGKRFKEAIKLIDQAIAKKPSQEPFYAYDRLVAQFHDSPKEAMASANKILAESNGDIGAYRMIISIFASQKDLTLPVYRYGRTLVPLALKKGQMQYMFLAMGSEISASLGEFTAAVSSQEEAVGAAEKDPNAPKEFVDFLKKKLEEFRKSAEKPGK